MVPWWFEFDPQTNVAAWWCPLKVQPVEVPRRDMEETLCYTAEKVLSAVVTSFLQ